MSRKHFPKRPKFLKNSMKIVNVAGFLTIDALKKFSFGNVKNKYPFLV